MSLFIALIKLTTYILSIFQMLEYLLKVKSIKVSATPSLFNNIKNSCP